MVTKNLYGFLEVPDDASEEEIKSAYRKLAKKYHPDVTGLDRGKAEEIFKNINVAYDVLSNPAKRSMYDQSLKYGEFRATIRPAYNWIYLAYLDGYGWSRLYKKGWNEHHEMMYR